MNFDPTEEQSAIFEMASQFATSEIAPHARAWEEAGTIPREMLEVAGSLGLGGLLVCSDHGGSDLKRLDAIFVFEALAMACPSVAAFMSIHNMCAWMIDRFGAEALRSDLLPKLSSFGQIASYCLTEPGSGSDAAALRTRAERHGDHYVLNGTKAFISGGDYSDCYIVMCRTGGDGPKGISALIVERGTPGLSFGAQETKMGWKAQPTAALHFDACRVPASHLLGQESEGFSYAMTGLDGGRLNIAACSLGGAQAAFTQALKYASERSAFGKPIGQFQAIQFKLADMEVDLQTARVFLRQAAWKLDQKHADAPKYCAMAKRYVTDVAFKVANEALQIHGGYGYLADYGIEKIVRDLRVHQILEGSNEIMRVIIGRELMKAEGD